MKILFFIISHLSFTLSVFAQGHEMNFEKYRHYRDRLKTEFMAVGDQPGMSMPAERIDTAAKAMHWADNTIWLGWHIGMLALEYHLLTDEKYVGFDNGDTDALTSALDELYFALIGLRRLDESAESSFPPPCDSIPGVRNGFFLRDDVPIDFHINFPGMNSAQSDGNHANVYDKEMSQDQVYHILLGIALVKKYIPASIVVNGMNLRQEAVDQALLIADWVNRDGWTIKNPVCQNKNVDRGADAALLSYGINEAVKFISDNTVNYDSDITSLYEFTWSTLVSPANPAYANTDNLHMAMALAAVGKGWSDTTLNVLMELAIANRWYAYPLIYVALHNDTDSAMFHAFRDTMNFWAENMLNEAPPEGPYTLHPDSVTHGYAVNNRFIRPREIHYIGNHWTVNCKFNGLDYMMLHNLYYTVTPSKWPHTHNGITASRHDDLKLFPNPASDELFIHTSDVNEKIHVAIFNSLGQLEFQADFMNRSMLKVEIGSLSSGIYFVTLTGNAGNKRMGRFMKD